MALKPYRVQVKSGVYIINFVVYARSTDEAFGEAELNLKMWPDLASDDMRMTAIPMRGETNGRNKTVGH